MFFLLLLSSLLLIDSYSARQLSNYLAENTATTSQEKCIEKCCMDHSVPMKCVEEKSESQMKSGHNSTHLVVTLVMSNECHDYQEILEMCKLECKEDTKEWSEWSACSKECGGGERTRTMKRSTQLSSPESSSQGSLDNEVSKEACNTQSCEDNKKDGCIMKCCMDHGLPHQCLGEDMNFDTVANQNTSHLVVKTVITKQCHKYKGIIDDCKSECLEKKTTEAPKPVQRKSIGEWEDFGECEAVLGNKGCGTGKLKQRRDCTNGDIEKCTKSDTERIIDCNLPDCKKELGEWKNEGICQPKQKGETCGDGIQKQVRSCIDGTTDKCTDADRKRDNKCFIKDCPKQLGNWENDGKCEVTGKDKTCGPGKQAQKRSCKDGTVDKCSDEDRRRVIPCSLPDCKKRFEKWENDGNCQATNGKNCGDGFQLQTRICHDGTVDKCTSTDTKRSIPCKLPKCPIDCVWSRFSVWTSCSVTCGGGLKTSSRTIAQKALNGGKECDGDSVRGEKCNTQPCPVDCEYENWGECENVKCNGNGLSPSKGIGTRQRKIKVTARLGGVECKGKTNGSCEMPCPEHCQLHDWSNWEWSNEEKKCGVGIRRRTIKECALHGGDSCEKRFGNNYDKETKEVICKVDCKLGPWNNWEPCSVTCGKGKKSRNREILKNPVNGGTPCQETVEFADCTTGACHTSSRTLRTPRLDLGNCIMDCCVKHGLPIHCVQQNLDSITSDDHNNTHVVVTSVLSKECHDYKKILKECKAECVSKD